MVLYGCFSMRACIEHSIDSAVPSLDVFDGTLVRLVSQNQPSQT